MAKYAIVQGAIVVNVVIADSVSTAAALLPGSTAINVDALSVSVGDTYNGSVFTPAMPRPKAFISELLSDVFGGKITGAELTALGGLVNTDPQHRVMWDMFAGCRISTETYLNYLVLKGTITAARRDEFKV